MKKKELIKSLVFFFVFTLFICVFLPIGKALNNDVFITIQFLLIGFVSVLMIAKECINSYFSIRMMHWFFIFAFLFCGGISQFAENSYLWKLNPTREELVASNYTIIIWIFSFLIADFLFVRNKAKTMKGFLVTYLYNPLKINEKSKLVVCVFLLVCGLFTLAKGGINAFYVRRLYYSTNISSLFSNNATKTVVNSLIQGFSLWASMECVQKYKKSRKSIDFVVFCFFVFIMIICIPPTAVARYTSAACYGALFIYSTDFFKEKYRFVYFISFALLFLFPILNAFRGNVSTEITQSKVNSALGDISENFLDPDYDAYSMLVYTVKYVGANGVSFGRQLLGVILFFIPRSLWPNKPIGSGATIISNMTENVAPNVSCNMIAEGYINFGIIGVFSFAIIFCIIMKKVDLICHNLKNDTIGYGMYCCLVPFTIYLMRGDLLSTFSFLIGYLVTLVFLTKIGRTNINRNNANLYSH